MREIELHYRHVPELLRGMGSPEIKGAPRREAPTGGAATKRGQRLKGKKIWFCFVFHFWVPRYTKYSLKVLLSKLFLPILPSSYVTKAQARDLEITINKVKLNSATVGPSTWFLTKILKLVFITKVSYYFFNSISWNHKTARVLLLGFVVMGSGQVSLKSNYIVYFMNECKMLERGMNVGSLG